MYNDLYNNLIKKVDEGNKCVVLTFLNSKNNNLKEQRDSKEIDKNNYFMNLSHELRTPINIFYSTIQLLDRFYDLNIDNFQDIYEKYRKSLHTNCKRMLRLVNNIIDIFLTIHIISYKMEYVHLNYINIK